MTKIKIYPTKVEQQNCFNDIPIFVISCASQKWLLDLHVVEYQRGHTRLSSQIVSRFSIFYYIFYQPFSLKVANIETVLTPTI